MWGSLNLSRFPSLSAMLQHVEYDPASIFNQCTLHLHVPSSPIGLYAPESTHLDQSQSKTADDTVDEWVTRLSQSNERDLSYYGDYLPAVSVASSDR